MLKVDKPVAKRLVSLFSKMVRRLGIDVCALNVC